MKIQKKSHHKSKIIHIPFNRNILWTNFVCLAYFPSFLFIIDVEKYYPILATTLL